jgi:hypothetical protein
MTNDTTLFINGQPHSSQGVTSSGIGTPSAEQSELDTLMMAKDDHGNLRFTTDPEYRDAIHERTRQLTAVIKHNQGLESEEPMALYDDRDPMTKVLDNEEMLDFLEAKDRYGHNRMSSDPEYRQAVYDYFQRKYPDSAEGYHEVIG